MTSLFQPGKMVLGTVQFGLNYGISNTRGQVRQEEVCRLLEHAHAKGISMLDTAAAYGESENVIGQALKQTQLPFRIISKLAPAASPSEVRQQVETSLEALGTSKLYGYMLHSYSSFEKSPRIMEQLYLLQDEGLVEKVGLSLYHPQEAQHLLQHDIKFDLTQFPYNVFDQRFDVIAGELQAKQVEVHARSAFLQGLFFMQPESLPAHFNSAASSIRAIQKLANERDIPLHALLMLFVLAQPGIDKLVFGVDSLEALQQNLEIGHYEAEVLPLLEKLKSYKLTDENILLPYKWKST